MHACSARAQTQAQATAHPALQASRCVERAVNALPCRGHCAAATCVAQACPPQMQILSLPNAH
ncbi:hypothetical protein COEREDRAFT_92877 [Coemansia reversa NRRL 1564]|uniref:Uncharacterized protein n=1 Tax=Coemansia reversa (strain ATCC 12441 / NRRL 1564) TaxID=763665 RepID=A0A2G5BA42_COERN|nr:hypothetical protein COEREDRAFT_92877 [Coemansia reversa NRRL 1564]|eukprot:PIA15860.1 hypothetical protein COEREDRAFT_92877 [Coemansia reversa NRRL 1564]